MGVNEVEMKERNLNAFSPKQSADAAQPSTRANER